MKRIISALVAMLMLLTMVPAFAAIEVDNTSPSSLYFNTFEGKADITGTSVGNTNPTEISGSKLGVNKDHPANFEFKDEQYILTRPEDSAKTSLTYIYFAKTESGIKEDKFAIGFDVKFSGITSNDGGSVLALTPGMSGLAFTDYHQSKIDSGEWYVGEGSNSNKAYETATDTHKASQTSWLFYKDGSARPSFTTKNAEGEDAEGLVLGENGQPAVFCGKAQLEQDKFYTFRMSIDQTTKTFNVVIIDGEEVIETGINGQIQNACSNFYKIDTQLQPKMNIEASVTIDNIFSERLGLTISAPSTFAPNEGNTVEFKASIPDDVENPAVYINDTFVENLALTQNKTDYIITSALPEGTALGDVKIEIRGTQDGEDVSASAISEYVRSYEKEIEAKYADKKITGYDGETPYYGIGDTRTDSLNPSPLVDGLFEIGAKIKRATSMVNIRLRSDTVIPTGGTSYAVGALFDGVKDPWKSWDMGALGVPASDTTNWHDLKLVVDYRGNAFENAQPYSICVDDNTPFKGTFKMHPESTINGFVELGMYNVYYKDVYIKEIIYVGADEVYATYNNGTTATYEDEALITPGLSNLTVALNTAFDSADAMKFVDEFGNDVSGVTLSVEDENVVITPDNNFTIPTGSYKLVIDKAATFGGEELGANLEVPVELSAPATVMEPAEGEVVSEENVTITLFAEDAEKVAVFVNDAEAKMFDTASDNGVYTFSYIPTVIGTNYVDVYIYTADGLDFATSSFVWAPSVTINLKESTIDALTDTIIGTDAAYGSVKAEDTGKDGSFAVEISTKLGGGNRFANFGFSGVQRIGVREYDIKINNDNTYMFTELGVSLDGTASVAGSNYPNFTDLPGTAGKAMFKNGVIAGSSTPYEVGKWYRVKHIIDWENFKTYVYVDGALVAEHTMTNSTAVANKATVANYSKYRFNIIPVSTEEGSAIPSISLDNVKSYEISAVPVASFADKTITAGTNSVDVTLGKAYDSLTPIEVEVKTNGKAVDGASVEIAEDGKTITVSGLAGVKAGTKLEVIISPYSLYKGVEVGYDSVATVFVADVNNLCVLPLNVESTSGTDLFACSKYLNGSGNTLNSYLIVTEFDASNKVKQTSFNPVTILAGETGLVYSYNTVTSAQGCKVMLWNSDLAQLTETGSLSQ